MSEEEQKVEAEAAAEVAAEEESLLSQAIGATKQTERSQAEDLLRTLTEQALEGTVTWSKNLTATFNKAIEASPKFYHKAHENLKKLEVAQMVR